MYIPCTFLHWLNLPVCWLNASLQCLASCCLSAFDIRNFFFTSLTVCSSNSHVAPLVPILCCTCCIVHFFLMNTLMKTYVLAWITLMAFQLTLPFFCAFLLSLFSVYLYIYSMYVYSLHNSHEWAHISVCSCSFVCPPSVYGVMLQPCLSVSWA